MNLKSELKYSQNDITNICLVIQNINDEQNHIGFLFSNTDEEVKFLHLAWHNSLQYDDPPIDKSLWVDIPFNDQFNIDNFKIFLELIFEKNGKHIPYGISMNGLLINTDGTLDVDEPYAGFTCATFVMSVFHTYGYKIIDIDNWEHRQEDNDWQKIILDILEKSGSSKEQIKYQKKQMGEFRFKPEEVMAASISLEQPVDFDNVKDNAEEIINQLYEYIKN